MESNVHRMYLIWFYPTCYLVVFSISKKLSKLYSSVLLDTIGSEPKRKFLTWGKWEYWWLVAGWLWRESRNISITRQSYTFSLLSPLSLLTRTWVFLVSSLRVGCFYPCLVSWACDSTDCCDCWYLYLLMVHGFVSGVSIQKSKLFLGLFSASHQVDRKPGMMLPVTLCLLDGFTRFLPRQTLVKTSLKVNESEDKNFNQMSPPCGNFSCALMGLFLSSNKMEQYINISVKFTSKPNFTGDNPIDNLDSRQAGRL